LRAQFLRTDLTTHVETPTEEDPSAAHDETHTMQVRQQVVDWAKGQMQHWPTTAPSEQGFDAPSTADRSLTLNRLDTGGGPSPGPLGPAGGPGGAGGHDPGEAGASGGTPPGQHAGFPSRALQIHNRYLVAESDDGVMVIDQHALHERILYENLRHRIGAGPVESQSLLVPEPVDLSPSEVAAALEHCELFEQLGMRIEPFGGDTLLISGYPAMLANMRPTEVLHALLEPILSGDRSPGHRDLLDDLLHTIACKAAIKAGDRLAPEEVTALLQQRHLIDDPHHCPHGRPTAVIFSQAELDKQFKRV